MSTDVDALGVNGPLLGSAQLQLHQFVHTAADAKSDCTLITLVHHIQSSFHSQAALILMNNSEYAAIIQHNSVCVRT